MNKNYNFFLCCDSADFYAWIYCSFDKYLFERQSNGVRSLSYKLNDSLIEIQFIIKQSNSKLYNEKTKKFLSCTAGTPDYILFDENLKPIMCIEDSKTAPVGNSVIQRLDKLFPLMMNKEQKCPVKYVVPKSGLDASQNKMRTWEQSWFYKSFAKNREDFFVLTENCNVSEISWSILERTIENYCHGVNETKKDISTQELTLIYESMKKNIRTYDGNNFRGKLFKPNKTDAHPVQSTLMLISEIHRKLDLPKVKVHLSAEHKNKFLSSKSKRVVKIKQNGCELV